MLESCYPLGYFAANTRSPVFSCPATKAPVAAFSMRRATACGWDTYTAWLPLTSTTVEPARLDIARWASGGIILSSVETKYQLGFVRHAGWVIAVLGASTPHGTWESAMNAAASGLRSAANEAGNFALSRNRYPSWGGRIGGTGAPGGGSLISVDTDSP